MLDYKTRYNHWLNSNALSDEDKLELTKMSEAEIEDAFNKNLEFGTGGMRGIMSMGTNRMNEFVVRKATFGFAKYLLENDKNAKTRGVVIAHDNRKNSDLFSNVAAKTLSALGIKAYLFDSLRPTPELSFAVRYLNASGGIVVTASHNPKEYNGYKIYNQEGCQLILEESNKVLAKINEIEDELAIDIKENPDLIVTLDNKIDEAYYQMVIQTRYRKDLDLSDIKVVYSPQHGTGYVPVMEVLKRNNVNVIPVECQAFPSITFENTLSPNPEDARAYIKAIEVAKANDANLIICTDPDCDRVGVVLLDSNKEPVYLTGNQTGSILMDYILKTKKEQNKLNPNSIVYNTIVTSPLGMKVANSYNVYCKQTLTGFKYIGTEIENAIINHGPEFVMGYEESYGYLLNPNVRDKDGVQSVLVIVEMASYYKKQGLTLLDVFKQLQDRLGYHIESQYSYETKDNEGKLRMEAFMNRLRNKPMFELANEKISYVEDYLTLTRTYNDSRKETLDFEQSNVLRFVFLDGSFIAIRPSGTEPKCKFYFAFCGKTYDEAKARHDKLKDTILGSI